MTWSISSRAAGCSSCVPSFENATNAADELARWGCGRGRGGSDDARAAPRQTPLRLQVRRRRDPGQARDARRRLATHRLRAPRAERRDLGRRIRAAQAVPAGAGGPPRPAGGPHRARRDLADDRTGRPLPPRPQGAAEARRQPPSLLPGDDPPRSVRHRPRAPRGRAERPQRIAHVVAPRAPRSRSFALHYAPSMAAAATLLMWFSLRSPELAEDFERLMAGDRDVVGGSLDTMSDWRLTRPMDVPGQASESADYVLIAEIHNIQRWQQQAEERVER